MWKKHDVRFNMQGNIRGDDVVRDGGSGPRLSPLSLDATKL
jgi:hypothetical protein